MSFVVVQFAALVDELHMLQVNGFFVHLFQWHEIGKLCSAKSKNMKAGNCCLDFAGSLAAKLVLIFCFQFM